MNEQGAAALVNPADPAIGHRLVFVGVGLTPGARASLEDAAVAAGGRVVLVADAVALATVLPQVVEAAPLRYSGVPTIPGRAGFPEAGFHALNNNGDGSYISGVFSRRTFSVLQGLGLEARLSVPVSRAQWQGQTLAFRSERSQQTARRDRRTGGASRDAQHAGEECQFNYPAGEGLSAVARLGFASGGTVRLAAADSAWPTGAWRTVRLQIFPDGTCGVAVDGVPVWRSEARVPVGQPYRVWLFGNSADTDRILVGRVVVWQGVRQDVEWESR